MAEQTNTPPDPTRPTPMLPAAGPAPGGAASRDLALRIVRTLQDAGHVAYFAGGCVRDQIMGREPNDYDVATAARPEQVLALFPRAQKVGVAFGVVLVRRRSATVEVATFRAEGAYSDGRHPDSVRFTTAEEDAQRRDFTCNGLFYDPLAHRVLDYVGGQADIATKVLRAIGEPAQRFAEDHLRMLRAVRFGAKLGFTIDPQTREAMAALQDNIATISRERIGEEIRMMLEHPTRAEAMETLIGFPRLFTRVFGNIPYFRTTAGGWPRLARLPAVSRVVALRALAADVAAGPGVSWHDMANRLREALVLSNDEYEAFVWLSEKLPVLEAWPQQPKAVLKRVMAHRWWPDLDVLYRAGPWHEPALPAYQARVAELQAEGVAPPPWITGDTLITLGARPGPKFKAWLDALYDRQLEGELSSKEQATAAARQLIATG